jgi:hypothetical protein
MSVLLNVVFIQIIVCFIIDLSGVIQSLETALSKWTKVRCVIPKPFSCSLCSGWWINLIYLIAVHQFTLPYIVFVAIISFFSKNISGFLRWIQELLVKIEDLLYKIIR